MHTRNMTEVSSLTIMPAARTGQRTGGRAQVLCSSKIAMTTCTSICWSREGQPISRASYGRGAFSVSVTSVARACSDQPDLFVLSATCCASSTMLTSNLRRERSTSFRCWLGRTARLSRWVVGIRLGSVYRFLLCYWLLSSKRRLRPGFSSLPPHSLSECPTSLASISPGSKAYP